MKKKIPTVGSVQKEEINQMAAGSKKLIMHSIEMEKKTNTAVLALRTKKKKRFRTSSSCKEKPLPRT